ncbi:MAG: DUF6328 family protein [Brachybacterium sp.]|nr:DUF6328 family protein [Brachybacterium sp.]
MGPADDRDDALTSYTRDEPRAQQLDRNWNELLQEIRVIQTGSQILAAFLIVLPFQARFEELDTLQTGWYLGLLTVSLAIVGINLAPVSLHRKLFGRRVKGEVVRIADTMLKFSLAMLGLLLVGVAVFIFDVVVSRTAGLIAGVGLGTLVIGLQFAYPALIARRG